MSFFFNETKAEVKPKGKAPPKKRQDIPIASLQQLGCSVCPRDQDKDLISPKMRPSGAKSPLIYLLGSAPSEREDEDDNHWTDKPGEMIYSKFGRAFMQDEVRSNFITQCRGDQTVIEIECCRGRIVADIEQSKPLLIVTIGDAPFQWATGVTKGGVMPHRGTIFVAKIGTHVCYVMPLLYPNFVFKKKQYGKSEYELALEMDVRKAKAFVQSPDFEPAKGQFVGPYDQGVEVITGREPGDLQRLERALQKLAREPNSAIDIETNGLRPYFLKDPKIWMVAAGTFEHTVVFPVDHPDGWGGDGTRRKVWGLLLDYLLASGRKACHNLALEMEWFGFFFSGEILRRTEWDDTMGMCHTLDERGGTKSLGMQTRIHFGFDVKALSNIDVKRILEYPLRDTLRYCGLDTKWTDKLRRKLEPLVEIENRAEYERKLRLAPTLVLTEAKGMPADMRYARDLADKLEGTLESVEAKLRRTPEVRAYGTRFGSFSPTNPDHVLKLMRDICRRDEIRVEDNKGGERTVRYTTDEEALLKIPAGDVPAAALILEHRSASKLLGTYVQPVLAQRIVCPDGRIRSKYSSMVAVTGRLSSDDPNIQNWPARKHREIRGIVHAGDGEIIAACDYGQIEFRVVGMASEDPNLVRACWTGYDVHKFWAERLLEIYPPMKDHIVREFEIKDWDDPKKGGVKVLRQDMKNMWVFPQLFGSSLRSCAENLHLPDNVAEDLGAEFWDEFRVVKKWHERTLQSYEKNLYVETLGGRKRRGPQTKNEIINHPIQGTALDIVTLAMNVLSERSLLEEDPDLQPNFNGHDDLSFWLPEVRAPKKIESIVREMCLPRFDYINVPLVVEVKTGKRWHDLQEIGVYRSDVLFQHANPYK